MTRAFIRVHNVTPFFLSLSPSSVRKLGTSVTKRRDIGGNGKQPSPSQRRAQRERKIRGGGEAYTFARAFIKLGHCRAVESVFLVSAEPRRDKQLHGPRALFAQASPFLCSNPPSAPFLYPPLPSQFFFSLFLFFFLYADNVVPTRRRGRRGGLDLPLQKRHDALIINTDLFWRLISARFTFAYPVYLEHRPSKHHPIRCCLVISLFLFRTIPIERRNRKKIVRVLFHWHFLSFS